MRNARKICFLIAGIFLFGGGFLFNPGKALAADPGCSPEYPVCLGTTVVNQKKCNIPVLDDGELSCDDGWYWTGNRPVSCGARACSFQWCSSNDDFTCEIWLMGRGAVCSPNPSCTSAGNCCGGGGGPTPTPGGGGDGDPTPTPTPTPDPAPIGSHDSATGGAVCSLWGWTCDPSRWGDALQVHVYVNDGGGYQYVGVTTANTWREDAVKQACGNSTNYHGFDYSVPGSWKDGASHSYYAFAIGIDGAGNPNGDNPLLNLSPRSMVCAVPTPTPTPTPTLFPTIPPPPTPTPTRTPTPTPTPAVCVVLNQATGLSCDTVCSNRGAACLDTGTNASATDDSFWFYQISQGVCRNTNTGSCSRVMPNTGQTCHGNLAEWTNCRCAGACATPTPTPTPTPSPTPTPTPVTVSGTVYDGAGGIGGFNKCLGFGGIGIKPGGGSKVTVNPDGRDGPVQGNGSYQVNQVLEAGAKTITLGDMAAGYQCSCPGNCEYTGADVSGGNNSGWDFYVSNILGRWAQIIGGHAHGQSGAAVAVPAGNYLMIRSGFSNKSGAASKTSGNFTTAPGELSSDFSLLTDGMDLSTWRYSYQRLWVRAGSPTADPGDGTSPPQPGIYRKSGNFAIKGPDWQKMAGERIIFVDGNLKINSKVTLAGAGDFLAVIVSGNIEVDPGVGDSAVASPAPSDADLVGAFLADGDFSGGSDLAQTDKQLVIYGTVAADIDLNGAGDVKFQRDMGVGNNTGPGVAVIWNPALVLNVPDELTDALTDWREVAP